MTTTTVKAKKGVIRLPRQLQKMWGNAEIYMRVSGDTAILKRVYKPGNIFDEQTVRKLKKAGKTITDKDIAKAVKWARVRA